MAGIMGNMGVGTAAAAGSVAGIAGATSAVAGHADSAVGQSQASGLDSYTPTLSNGGHPLAMARRHPGSALFRALGSALDSLMETMRPKAEPLFSTPARTGMSYGTIKLGVPKWLSDRLNPDPLTVTMKKLRRYGTMDCERTLKQLIETPDVNTLPALLKVLVKGDKVEKMYAGDALVALGEPAIPGLIQLLGDDSTMFGAGAGDLLVRINRRNASSIGYDDGTFGQRGPEQRFNEKVVRALITASKSPNPLVRRRALEALTNLPFINETRMAIDTALDDPDRSVRKQALSAAAKHDMTVRVSLDD